MKLFYTPAIDGQYREDLKRRMADIPNDRAYATVEKYLGQQGVDELDDKGWVKIKAQTFDANQSGYFTYQQDDL